MEIGMLKVIVARGEKTRQITRVALLDSLPQELVDLIISRGHKLPDTFQVNAEYTTAYGYCESCQKILIVKEDKSIRGGVISADCTYRE